MTHTERKLAIALNALIEIAGPNPNWNGTSAIIARRALARLAAPPAPKKPSWFLRMLRLGALSGALLFLPSCYRGG